MTADAPTIVFVHGAWADASGFGESIRAMRERGFAAIDPLRHLTGDEGVPGNRWCTTAKASALRWLLS